jgi:hypothetical protein
MFIFVIKKQMSESNKNNSFVLFQKYLKDTNQEHLFKDLNIEEEYNRYREFEEKYPKLHYILFKDFGRNKLNS